MSIKAQKTLGRISSGLGLLLILLIVVVTGVLTVPRLLGYDAYTIITGSMSPTIPVGSLVYAQTTAPATLQGGDVVVFYGGLESSTVITHRVMENHTDDQEIITKGDANADNDVSPIPYRNIIGKVAFYAPVLGLFLPAVTTTGGKVYLLGILLSAVLFRVVGGQLVRQTRPEDAPRKKKKVKKGPLILLIVLLLGGMAFAGTKLGTLLYGYHKERSAYESLAALVTTMPTGKSPRVTPEPTREEPSDEPQLLVDDTPLPEVDWEALWAINGEVVGWLYSPDTIINYPVMQTGDNEHYLHYDLYGSYSASGTLFVETEAVLGVLRSNYIIYGHHMRDGSMLAGIENYRSTSFYEAHPVVYYLTPTQNYRVELIAGRIVEAIQESYPLYWETDEEYLAYQQKIMAGSYFDSGIDPTADYQILTMSTCDYTAGYNNPRMMVQGLMIPIAS